MGKLKKMKKLAEQSRNNAERAESAAQRAEDAHRQVAAHLGTEAQLGTVPDGAGASRPPIYTGASALQDTPAVADTKR